MGKWVRLASRIVMLAALLFVTVHLGEATPLGPGDDHRGDGATPRVFVVRKPPVPHGGNDGFEKYAAKGSLVLALLALGLLGYAWWRRRTV
jgi:hypothetical protein